MLTTMRQDLTAALKSRDRVAVAALRSALAAVENAGAVAVPQAAAAVGLGATEVPRRELDDVELRAVVRAEVRDRLDAADGYDRLGRPDEFERLRAEAAVLTRYLGS